jgi:hypothetical protein
MSRALIDDYSAEVGAAKTKGGVSREYDSWPAQSWPRVSVRGKIRLAAHSLETRNLSCATGNLK